VNKTATVLIVDDHPLYRQGLRQAIEAHTAFIVAGEACDGEAGLKLAQELNPDIAVVDIDMPRRTGFDLIRALHRLNSPVRVVFLTMYSEEDMFETAMDLGAKAYVLKDNAADEILAALERVAAGETFVSHSLRDLNRRRRDRVKAILDGSPQLEQLTSAERRILKMIAEDRSSKEIADLLNISVKTVDSHRLNICSKLNIHGTHSLLKFAFAHKTQL
jgi:DNA-binding NarL/FixJ family response regulator